MSSIIEKSTGKNHLRWVLHFGVYRDEIINYPSFSELTGHLIVTPNSVSQQGDIVVTRSSFLTTDHRLYVENILETKQNKKWIRMKMIISNLGPAINDLWVGVYSDFNVGGTFGNDTAVFEPATYFELDKDIAYMYENSSIGISATRKSTRHHIGPWNSFNIATVLQSPNDENGPIGPGDLAVGMRWDLGNLPQGNVTFIRYASL